jgi:hypothetical protein
MGGRGGGEEALGGAAGRHRRQPTKDASAAPTLLSWYAHTGTYIAPSHNLSFENPFTHETCAIAKFN